MAKVHMFYFIVVSAVHFDCYLYNGTILPTLIVFLLLIPPSTHNHKVPVYGSGRRFECLVGFSVSLREGDTSVPILTDPWCSIFHQSGRG